MLIDVNGRRRSSKTAFEDLKSLKASMDNLKPEELALVNQILEEFEELGASPTLEGLTQEHFETVPVSGNQFFEDKYFLGETGAGIFPVLKQDLLEIIDGGYTEIIWSGAIGTGKSTASEMLLLRMIYELSCLRDPQLTFGLMKGRPIVVAVVSVNVKQAIRTVFNNLKDSMDRSTFFSRLKPKISFAKGEMRFPKNIWLVVGSPGSNQLIGNNVIGALIDETDFLDKSKPKAEKAGQSRQEFAKNANKLYASIRSRMKSRFMKGGKMPGYVILSSSKSTVGSFTEQRIKEAKNDPTIFVREYATWNTKPPENFTGKWFHILVGDELIQSRILREDEVERVRAQIKGIGRSARVEKIPEEYREDFVRDLDAAVRDIAGVATMAITPYISNREKIVKALSPTRTHPFTSEIYVAGEQADFLWHLLSKRTEQKLKGGFTEHVWMPLINPGTPRHIHIDTSLGKQDALGFAMGHVSRWRDISRRLPDGSMYSELCPEIYVDFMLRVEAPPGGEINLKDIRTMIYALSKRGFQIALVTTDTHQYAALHQPLTEKGFTCDLLSMDKSPRGYQFLKSALYEDRLVAYNYPTLRKELIDIESDPITGRIDHPPVGSDGRPGSKDVADAVAGIVCSLTERAPQPLHSITFMAMSDDETGDDDTWVLGGKRNMVPVTEPSSSDLLPIPVEGGYDEEDEGWRW